MCKMCKENTYQNVRIIFILLLAFGILSVSAQAQKEIFTGNGLSIFKSTIFSNAQADLDQCANGGVGSLPVQCAGSAWQNGNLGHSQAHYLEGQSVPYRLRFSGLTVGSINTVTIEWDTTENSGAKHALDCLTNFDLTETTADPCSGVAECNLAVKDNFAIPPDTNFTAGFDGINGTIDDIPAMPGDFKLFNGDITAVSAYTMTGTYSGSSQTRITLTFTANTTNPVLAWGAHISRRVDWGITNSAIAISGSPFHMRLVELNGSGGNQDRSLSSAATIFPGNIVIIKDARPNTDQVFGFTTTGPGVGDFSLVDDGSNTANSQSFNNLTDFGVSNSVTVTENLPTSGYSLTQLLCVENAAGGTGQQNTTVNVQNRLANIILEEGESVTCTFVNAVPTAALATLSGKITDNYGVNVKDVSVTITNLTSGESHYTRTNSFGFYRFEEMPVGESYVVSVRSKRYAFVSDSMIITLMEDFAKANFTALPN